MCPRLLLLTLLLLLFSNGVIDRHELRDLLERVGDGSEAVPMASAALLCSQCPITSLLVLEWDKLC